jgi:DNA polymerase-1
VFLIAGTSVREREDGDVTTPATVLTTAARTPGTLRDAGLRRGQPLAVVAVGGAGLGLASHRGLWAVPAGDLGAAVAVVTAIETTLAPRWVWWSVHGTPAALVAAGLRPSGCWDLAAVHRLLLGGRRDDPASVWAGAHGLGPPPRARAGRRPAGRGQLDLLAMAEEAATGGDPDDPVRPDGHLRADWADELWADGPWRDLVPATGGAPAAGPPRGLARAARWAKVALDVRDGQERLLREQPDPRPRPGATALAVLTARAESAAELLAGELECDGLPVDRAAAERMIAASAGPRPRDSADDVTIRRSRDEPVLAHLPGGVDLRNPASVRSGLRAVGIEVPDTRSGRLERMRGTHPAVGALLDWRKAERIATTYGYRWLDTFVGADGRLRGAWQGSDGAGGRMTAQAGLHNLPTELRVAVAAEPGHLFVRADLGQIEPRVLAAVSGDPAFARATAADDMYAPVAARLACERPVAKVAVLAAMYGQTSGAAGVALRQMRQAYPRALAYLDAADADGRAGRDVRTFGGRLIRTAAAIGPASGSAGASIATDGTAVAARGRFARNAVVQGAAAELFKAWAVTVRHALGAGGGNGGNGGIVLCLHDELLLHVATERADDTRRLLHETLAATAAYWAAGSGVRFVADVTVVKRWSDAKA